jgi:hypothetical protein
LQLNALKLLQKYFQQLNNSLKIKINITQAEIDEGKQHDSSHQTRWY